MDDLKLSKFIYECTNIVTLLSIRNKVNKQLEFLEEQQIKESIYDDVKAKSFSVHSQEIDIDGLEKLPLRYYVECSAWDKAEFSDAKIYRTAVKQEDWVSLLKVDYEATDNDIYEDNIDDWNWNSHDSPATCIGYIYLYLYYSSESQENPGLEAYVIDEEGRVEKYDPHKDYQFPHMIYTPNRF